MVQVIQSFLAPAIMFSAGGLLLLAQFARFTAVLAQVRGFNRERFAVLEKLGSGDDGDRARLEQRAEGLERQACVVLAHAKTIRRALLLLVSGILSMVACSLSIGASLAVAAFGHLALGLFILGLLCTLGGLCFVFAELRVSMSEIEFEHHNLESFRRDPSRLSAHDPTSAERVV